MKSIVYKATVNEMQNFMTQIRVLRPDLSLKVIEVLYYVWKYPDSYEQELIKNKMYKSLPVITVSLSNITDMELLENVKVDKKTKKVLSKELATKIVTGPVKIVIELNELN